VSRDARLYLADIAEACSRIERFAAGRDDDKIMSDEIVREAILHNIIVIGEPAAQLSHAGIEALLPVVPDSRHAERSRARVLWRRPRPRARRHSAQDS
jgi:uncharacterized protein with HEPN domain